MTQIVVGVDGGGSKTRVLVADARGEPLGGCDGPGSAVRPGAVEHSAEVIAGSVSDALAVAGLEGQRPAVLCVGVAGVGRAAEREELWSALTALDVAAEVVVLPDAKVALDDAFGDGPGILLVAGTGSIAFGRGPAGAEARVGGWGPVCGDEGSGAWIGRRALSVVTASLDGREPETALVGAVLTAAELHDPSELVAWASAASTAQLAALAATVVSAAENGDLRANSILDLAAEELALHVRTLARELFADERAACPVAFAGGLLKVGSSLRKRLEHRLKSSTPGAELSSAEVRPERGAVRAALAALGGGEPLREEDGESDAAQQAGEGDEKNDPERVSDTGEEHQTAAEQEQEEEQEQDAEQGEQQDVEQEEEQEQAAE